MKLPGENPSTDRDRQALNNCQRTWCLFAPSKLNLGLRVTGRRPDGYHLLQSLFWPLDLADSIQVTLMEGQQTPWLTLGWAEQALRRSTLPSAEGNLAWRAMRSAQKIPPQLRIEITKQIPIGAGLGGGSSNAGSLLRFFASQGWISESTLSPTALSLGADVPYFLDPRPTWVEGIGEKRMPIAVEKDLEQNLRFLLVLPPQGTSTKDVFDAYHHLGLPPVAEILPPQGPLDLTRLTLYLREARNCLEPAAVRAYPVLGDILSELSKTPALYTGLSGSGSTCFAVFAHEALAHESAQDLQSFFRRTQCQSFIARTFLR